MIRTPIITSETANKIFTGKHKYTVGIIFIFGNLAGYFLNMRKINVSDTHSVVLLIFITLIARLVV